jgi:hypothetical protein
MRVTTLTAYVADGGRVTVRVETPVTVTSGADRTLLRWSVFRNDADAELQVRLGDGFVLPAGCELVKVGQWPTVQSEVPVDATWPDYPRIRLDPHSSSGIVQTLRRDVPSSCHGTAEAVVAIDAPAFTTRPVIRHIPLVFD